MKLRIKKSKLTYKYLLGYSLGIIALLLVAVPVFANTTPGSKLLDFSHSDNTGLTPQSARPLTQGINVAHLNPGEENWYIYSKSTANNLPLSWVSLAMRYQSEAVINPDQVNFEIFNQESDSWFQGAEVSSTALGSGIRSPLQTTGQNLVESFWTGHIETDNSYYVRVFNYSPFSLDYALEAKVEQPAASGAIPASTGSLSANAAPLNARQLAWTLTAQAVSNMPAERASEWMQQAQAVGWIVTAGTSPLDIPTPDEASPQTLWNLTAQAIEGQDAEAAAEWLIQADSLGWLSIPFSIPKDPNDGVRPDDAGGGDDDNGGSEPPAQPAPPDEVYTPVNIYPNEPLMFDLNHVNSGRLAPYGEHWYELTRDDFDDELIEGMKMTMFFTPRLGYISDRVNFEIFPASQYHIWSRGDSDYMEHFGAGQWVSRDEDPNTGERLWAGSLVDGDRYLVKVKNGTPDVVDYYLFPNDVENAELGNPTLYRANGSAAQVQVPYAVSPPTRASLPAEPGESPPEAIPVKMGITRSTLQAGQELWYQFLYHDRYEGSTPQHDFRIYLTNTPLDDVRARHAEFEIYPGNQMHIWTRGTTNQLEPFGRSADSPNQLKNEKSLQMVWNGQLMEDHVYFIRVHNYDIGPLEYELEIQGGP